MRKRGSGLLIHVSSIAGRSHCRIWPVLLEQVRARVDRGRVPSELAPFGIDSVVVEPGAFNTPIFEKPFSAADETCAGEYGTQNLAIAFTSTFRRS